MKNEVFNGHRFLTYFKYDLTQMWRNHMKAAILIGFSGLIIYILGIAFNAVFEKTWMAPNFGVRLFTFMIALFALELYQTRTYGYLTNRKRGSSWLMMPASGFEKWLSMILITLIVIPVAFLCTYTLVDGILALADPTYDQMLLGAAQHTLEKVNAELVTANTEYATTWSLSMFIVPVLANYVCYFLYFLLCGITFRRNKIVWAFVILFLGSILLSTGMTAFGLQNNYDVEEFAEAEVIMRGVLKWITALLIVVAACLAGGIYYRVKTIKH